MPTFDIIKEVKPKQTFRVASVIGKFDLQSEHIIEHFKGDIVKLSEQCLAFFNVFCFFRWYWQSFIPRKDFI